MEFITSIACRALATVLVVVATIGLIQAIEWLTEDDQ